jgi:hypothetical protein
MTETRPINASDQIPPPAFRALRRQDKGARRQIIATGPMDGACFQVALATTQSDGPGHCDLIVMPNGEAP